MQSYIHYFLEEYGVKGVKVTPATADVFVIGQNSELLNEEDKQTFNSRVAKILFAAKRTRPDVLAAVAFLSTRVQQPTFQDMEKLERLLKYLNGTRIFWLTLEASREWGVFAFIDASHGVHADGKSHTGVCIFLS